MEEFVITASGLTKKEKSAPVVGEQDGFALLILAEEEWDLIPKLLSHQTVIEPEWIERYRPHSPQTNRSSVKEAYLGIHPRIDNLSPDIQFVCYRDLDEQGNERAVRFFLNENKILLFNWNGLKIERLSAWAKRGLVVTPLDLAQMLGSKVLNHHQVRMEKIEDQMDQIEEAILKGPRHWQQARIILLHRRIIGLKKSLNLHQSVFTRLANLDKTERKALWQELVLDTERELDNVRQAHELVESLREAYQAAVDNRSNDIMKLLTLLATILLPINLLTSFFGMNFRNMPLLNQPYGISVFYISSALIAIAAFIYFWKRNWLK